VDFIIGKGLGDNHMKETTKFVGRRLGRIPALRAPHFDPKHLHFKDFMKGEPPLIVHPYQNWMNPVAKKLPNGWGMMSNDVLGDCTCAAVGHGVQILTGVSGSPVTPSDADVQKMYQASGWNPADSANTDNGWTLAQALGYWETTGLAGHKIIAKIAVNPVIPSEVDLAIEVFGMVNIGIGLPKYFQGLNGEWNVPPYGLSGDGAPYSWGGHSVMVAGRTPNVRYCVTWGVGQWVITHNAFNAYVDECWAFVSEDWLKNGISPSGFDKAGLINALQGVNK